MTTTTPPSPRARLALETSRFTAGLERRVLKFIRQHDVLRYGEKVVVATSGGPDSTALLVSLARLRGELNLDLTAAYFNHLLRDVDETTADLDYVRSLASALDLSLVHSSGNVRAYASKNHLSIEDAARHLRYCFLGEQAAALGSSVVALGHTLDDQAETVLLHLIRGSGLDGLAGMRPRSRWPFGAGPDPVRPLLSLRRKDTERYCHELGVTPRRDSTNELSVATRNRLRKELIPALQLLNPIVDDAIARFAATAARDTGYLDGVARRHFARLARLDLGSVWFSRADLLIADPAITARLFRLAYAHVTGSAAGLEETHIETLLAALRRRPGGVSLPGGVTAMTDSASLVFRRGSPQPAARIPETPLAVPGRTEVPGYTIQVSVLAVPEDVQSVAPNEAFLDADRAGTELMVRSRRPGDRVRPLGLGGEKKLQDILVDAKLPAAERDGIPLVCAGAQIAWVVGHCIDERYAIRPDSQRALHILFHQRADC